MKSIISSALPPDFSRDVRCVLGLPFDAITEVEAEALLRRNILERRRCFMSTPNLNFAVACLSDAAFRLSVLQSDLSLADGWPVIAYGRLSGTRLPERVAGSTLFERVRASSVRPSLSVYFFGGPNGAAQAACKKLNTTQSGITCVGFEEPGFGSIEEMSTSERIDHINKSRPDILVLALGAKKGQAWIQRNLPHLDVPVVSHLGAVVNFVAGSVKRAPTWVQSVGLEWLWRVREEPSLWRRYAGDGSAFLRLLAGRFMPRSMPLSASNSSPADYANAKTVLHRGNVGTKIILSGPCTEKNSTSIRDAFTQISCRREPVSLDMSAVTHLDSSSIALMTLLYGWQLKVGLGWKIPAPSAPALSALRSAHADYLLASVRELGS